MLHPTIAGGNLAPALPDVCVTSFRSTGLADELPGLFEWHAANHGHWPSDDDDAYFESECRRDTLRRHLLALNLAAKDRIVGPTIRGLMNISRTLDAQREAANAASKSITFDCECVVKMFGNALTFTVRSPKTRAEVTVHSGWTEEIRDLIDRAKASAQAGEKSTPFTAAELRRVLAVHKRIEDHYAPFKQQAPRRRWRRFH